MDWQTIKQRTFSLSKYLQGNLTKEIINVKALTQFSKSLFDLRNSSGFARLRGVSYLSIELHLQFVWYSKPWPFKYH